MPSTIINDHDSIFTNEFWYEFFKLQGTQLNMSSNYHPHTYSQTNIVNKCLETYLWYFASAQLVHWIKWHTLV